VTLFSFQDDYFTSGFSFFFLVHTREKVGYPPSPPSYSHCNTITFPPSSQDGGKIIATFFPSLSFSPREGVQSQLFSKVGVFSSRDGLRDTSSFFPFSGRYFSLPPPPCWIIFPACLLLFSCHFFFETIFKDKRFSQFA